MTTPTPKILHEKFLALPQRLRDAMGSVETSDAIKKIGDNHKLHIDQLGQLSKEVGLVILGFTRPHLFYIRLVHTLNVSEETAGLIAKEVDEAIFSKINDYLKNPQATPLDLEPADQPPKENSDYYDQKMKVLFESNSDVARREKEKNNDDIPPLSQTKNIKDPYREIPD